jgi:hypothetical protein
MRAVVLSRDKHSSLFRKCVSYALESFIESGLGRGPYYKTLWNHNLQKIGRFQSKLESFLFTVTLTGMDKRTSLLQTRCITNL